ncbi:hypothetical protein NEIPOLOT_02350 [Neisseria polysaccharea ATCC 43768]|nr:hypothetical protein NEIPOLOT_02350 [Neisseria polysaccharea ATCC 43768]
MGLRWKKMPSERSFRRHFLHVKTNLLRLKLFTHFYINPYKVLPRHLF